MVKHNTVPEANGITVMDAREWFNELHDMGLYGFHADDIHLGEFSHLFTPAAEQKFCDIVASFHTAAANWPDPEFLYDIAGIGRFPAEKAYPSLILDMALPMAGRSNYSPVPGQEKPTIAVEEYNEFAAIEIDTPTGKLSDAISFSVIPLESASHTDTGIDTENATLNRNEAVTINNIKDLESAIIEMTSRKSRIHP